MIIQKYKKGIATVMAFLMIISLMPAVAQQPVGAASDLNFVFPNMEQSNPANAVTVIDQVLRLDGHYTGAELVSVQMIIKELRSWDTNNYTDTSKYTYGQTHDSAGAMILPNNEITVPAIALYNGLNEIEFVGTDIYGSVIRSRVFVKYQDSPALYDLKVQGIPPVEDLVIRDSQELTIVNQGYVANLQTNSVRVIGHAPNAQSVRVEVVSADGSVRRIGNDAIPAQLNPANNHAFSALVPLRPGVSTITIIATSNTHKVQTTRNLMFYNGNPTFYDATVEVAPGGTANTHNLLDRPYIDITNPEDYNLDTKLMVNKPTDFTGTTPAAIDVEVTRRVTNVNGTQVNEQTSIVNFESQPLDSPDQAVLIFKPTGPFNLHITDEDSEHGFRYEVRMRIVDGDDIWSANYDITANNQGANAGMLQFTLQNANLPRITSMELVNGVNQATAGTLTGTNLHNELRNLPRTPLNNSVIQQTPFYIAVNLSNASSYHNSTQTALGHFTINGSAPAAIGFPNQSSEANKTIFLRVDSLAQVGTQPLNLVFDNDTGAAPNPVDAMSVNVTYVFSPFMDYEQIIPNQSYNIPNITESFVINTLGNFRGTLYNIRNVDNIKYSPVNERTAELFVNGQYIRLEKIDLDDPTRFRLEGATLTGDDRTGLADVMGALKNGRNTLEFRYDDGVDKYERTINFFIISTNIPYIPATSVNQNTGQTRTLPNNSWNPAIFPYQTETAVPDAFNFNVDSSGRDFIGSNVLDTYNIFGSFKVTEVVAGNPQSFPTGNRLEVYRNGILLGSFNPRIHQVRIFESYGSSNYETINSSEFPEGLENLNVHYYKDADYGGYFTFELLRENFDTTGAANGYVFRVINTDGIQREYSLSVSPQYTPYRILHPFRDYEYIDVTRESDVDYNFKKGRYGIVNQNYVDIVVEAEGASRVLVNGQPAARSNFVLYDENGDPKTYTGVYKYTVKNLRAGLNRPNRITIQVESSGGNNPPPGIIEVFYAPTNIPGHNLLQPFTSLQGRYFNNELDIRVPRNATLIRYDVMRTEDMKTDVFGNHDVLIGIANSFDGVIQRMDHYDVYNAGLRKKGNEFDANFSLYRAYFSNFPSDFVMASKVFYLDAGMADADRSVAPFTGTRYEPITRGLLPFQHTKTIPFVAPGFTNVTDDDGNLVRKLPSYNDRPVPLPGTIDDTPDPGVPDQFDTRLKMSERGTITLAYDPNVTENASVEVSMFFFDDYLQSWVNIGGTVNGRNNTITAPFDRFGYYAVGKRKLTMQDVLEHPYARNEINAIYTKGIMKAVNPGFEFGVHQRMTRGEVATAIVKALQLPLRYDRTNTHFFDVPSGNFYTNMLYDFEHIETAAHYGIVQGAGPNEFRPGNDITREEFAVILARALDLRLQTDYTRAKQQLDRLFIDADDVRPYAVPAVLAITQAGYIKGKQINPNDPNDGYIFMPGQTLNRPDAAIVLSRVLQDKRMLPDFPRDFQGN
ncbi:S-layer homology domain-containing protein [Desulfuribacillus alkaliarsenatis]|uniref:SLH domain-containing protein n=1 Tax=Desulfuribacillus alkaliarsenatis TaxID=766136 RepID=A0A1E5G1L4_9FIRM|nr:S-layer homology domain-containing protein [Desulfuribacillus alkaliarsenatis]OEF96800.1 hypothetical protein BHF68_06975 [Desulfuribacillus alkaliarsenatis]